MTPPVPTTILLERERANSFRRHAEILHARCTDTVSFADLRMSQGFIEELAWYKGGRFHFDSPLITVEWAVGWANSVPPPPVALLRAAREMLQAAANDWAASYQMAHEIRAKGMKLHQSEWPDWLETLARVAASEQRRIEVILEENWPAGTEKEEEKTLKEMKGGTSLSLEEAFPQIAGVSKDEWERRVREHKKHRKP